MIKPINKRVLAQRQEIEQKTSGGLLLPDSSKKKSNTALIVATSNELDCPVEVGDEILLDRYVQEISIDGEDYLILKFEEIVAVLC